MIELRRVTFAYDGSEALSGIDLRLSRGDALALIGPNGSGKSTLLKLINGLVFPERGQYLFDGREITAKALKDPATAKGFHRRIGFLFQNPNAQLFCPSVFDEVAFGPRQMGLDEAEVAARVRDCLALLGIAKLEGRVPYRLSEGEKRKVALAAVLSLDPELLTLDEPMSGLDPKTKAFLRELLVSLKGIGKSIVCATHDFAYVGGIFDRAAVFSENHALIRVGAYEEIAEDREFLAKNNIL